MGTSVEDFLAQMNGTVEALVLAFGALVALHPEGGKVMELLESIRQKATTQAGDAEHSPQQAAYLAGTTAAVAQLAHAVALARAVRQMNQAGPTQ